MTAHAQPSAPAARIGHRAVLAIAVPIMASNFSEPMIGMVDTAILGQLGDAYHIGAIAVGSLIFSFLLWGFGFLRMGTSGLTAQAAGRRDDDGLRATLGRALLIAGACGTALVVLAPLIGLVTFHLVEGTHDVEANARAYFDIRIWSAPAALANYAVLGWFVGLGRAHIAFVLQLALNLLNAALDAAFVLWLDMGVEGVAAGTVIAQYAALAAGAWFVARELRGRGGAWSWARIVAAAEMRRTIMVNSDIMVRTICILLAVAWFTAKGAEAGDVVLAANAVLMNIVMLVSYTLDGFAYAAQALAGQAAGAQDRRRFLDAVRLSGLWAAAASVVMTLLIFALGAALIDLLTVNVEVRAAARAHAHWAALMPVVGVAAFLLDGVFIGATRTADMRNMMIVSALLYVGAWWLLTPAFGNHGLWASLLVFFGARGLTLAIRLPALVRDTFSSGGLQAGA